jgi:hypothetical protein
MTKQERKTQLTKRFLRSVKAGSVVEPSASWTYALHYALNENKESVEKIAKDLSIKP